MMNKRSLDIMNQKNTINLDDFNDMNLPLIPLAGQANYNPNDANI